ncbi:MAG: MFS transporter [Gammaproteobacteria bacterium]|nr:MFS transporter [Gammaproteobacteria bacterium]
MVRLGPIELADGVTRGHARTLLFAAFTTIGLLVFVGVATPYVLNVHLGVPLDEQGRVSGHLVMWTEITQLATFTLFGVVADRIGRRQVFALGYVVMALGYALYPYAGSTGELTVYRILYALGVSAATCMLATVVSDYPREQSRGRMVTLVGICNGLGIVALTVVFGRLPKWLTEAGYDAVTAGRWTLLIVAAAALVSGLIVARGLKPGLEVRREERPSIGHLLRAGFTAMRNPRITLAYSAAFVARGDLVILGTFTNLWGQAAVFAAGGTGADAMAQGKTLFVVAQIAALPWAGIAFFLIDRFNRVAGLALCMGLAAIGYLSIRIVSDPLAGATLPLFALLGIGQISAFLGATALIGQEAPVAERASVVAMFSFFGAVGILVTSLAGGYLYDHAGPEAPFVMIGFLNLIVLAAALLVRRYAPGRPRRITLPRPEREGL